MMQISVCEQKHDQVHKHLRYIVSIFENGLNYRAKTVCCRAAVDS